MSMKPLRAQAGASRRLLRALWFSLGLAALALVGAFVAVEIPGLIQDGHPLRGALLGGATVLLLVLGVIVASARWRGNDRPRLRRASPDAAEPTGIWGVGGPSMREPGNTGNWPVRGIDRRYEDTRD